MDCPKCKLPMRATGTLSEPVKGNEDKVRVVAQYFACDTCNESFVSYEGKKPVIVLPPKKTAQQIKEEKAAAKKKAIQDEKRRAYNEIRNAEKAAEKEREAAELMAFINAKPSEGVDAYSLNAHLGPMVIDRDAPKPKKAKKAVVEKKTTAEEEKKAKRREYNKKRYARIKAEKLAASKK